MTIAGGLVAAMLAGAVALSLGFASGQTPGASVVRPEPRVRTIERTITIHKKAKPKPAVVHTIAAPAAPAQAAPAAPARASNASASDDDATGMSDDDGPDDQFEGEEHDDESEGEDHEDDGGSEDD
jgi:hypothetical protein